MTQKAKNKSDFEKAVDEPTAKRAKLSDLLPDRHNANAGTERGQYMVDTSIEQFGAALLCPAESP
jgi:hypothetical protein